ncbi:MAG: eukaryotic-like serine/threonine-protein kinase, partial [Myxococcales bacterium]|nr:eukaryotic-like serine/threonine-protein kinase [Myxococcales bacterium]
MGNASELPKGGVRQGGKEELRASLLKTYLLRIRAEKGERAVRTVLANAGIDPSTVDNETGWISTLAAKKALRGICELLGMDALRKRGDWVTNAEALGALVRMLRSAEHPIDAYEYLAENAREVTRVGTWDLAVLAEKNAEKNASDKAASEKSSSDANGSASANNANKKKNDISGLAPPPSRDIDGTLSRKDKRKVDKSKVRAVRLVYRPRTDGYDEPEKIDVSTEVLFCAAREGELGGLPRIWGLPDAHVTHEACLAKGDDSCTYLVEWQLPATKSMTAAAAAGAAVVTGAAVGLPGGWIAGGLGAVLAGALGAGIARMWERGKRDGASRAFEKNRIAALER